MLILITIFAIFLLVLSLSYWKVPPFVAFIGISILAGIALGIPANELFKAVQEGISSTLGSIAAIIAFGSILGKWIGISGAAQQVTQSLLHFSGPKYARVAFMLAGFLVGLPLFYSVAFMIMAPLVITASHRLKQPATFLAIPMLASLTVTQGYLPPHPAPLAIMQEFGADFGTTLFYGVIIAIPAILISGLLFGSTTKNILTTPNQAFVYQADEAKHEKTLSLFMSYLLILMPILLLSFGSFFGSFIPFLAAYISNPVFSLLISVIFTWIVLILKGHLKDDLVDSAAISIKDIAGILLIFAGAGALKQILVVGGVSQFIANSLGDSSLNVYVLGWSMAAIIRVCVGSSTVAGITAAGFMKVILVESHADPNLLVLALGAGSMMFSHVNDTGFWLFREYFQLSLKDTLKSWTSMDTLVSITGLLGVLLLEWLIR
jgi:Gnt-I system high-affinity gluconate transporter